MKKVKVRVFNPGKEVSELPKEYACCRKTQRYII